MGRWYFLLAALAIAIAAGFWTAPALAASASGDTYQPASVDEVLNEDTSSSQLNGWHAKGEGGYAAEQIVSDARLAHQFKANSNSADDDLASASGIKKRRHMHPAMIVLLSVVGFLALVSVVVLIWSRIVAFRESHDAPMSFQ